MREPAASPHPGPVGTPLRAPKTGELIADSLRRRIVRGELRPGATLPPESQLMEQFAVSRPTLREAFRILEAESLIGVRRGARGGAQVLTPDSRVAARHVGLLLQMRGATISDVWEARTVTEPACARMLAERRTEADVADLRACVAEAQESLDDVDAGRAGALERLSSATARFHALIRERCGNITLSVQGAVLTDIVEAHTSRAVTAVPDDERRHQRFRRMLRSFARLADLVEAGDADGAEAHWHAHLDAAGKEFAARLPGSKPVVDLFT